MGTLDTLIKLHQRELDEKRLEMVELENQRDEILGYSDDMDKDLAKEQQFAAANPEVSITFENYRRQIRERQKNLKITVNTIDAQIEDLSNQIAEIFSELKRYEIIKQQVEGEEALLLKQKEDKLLDEMAINNHLQTSEE